MRTHTFAMFIVGCLVVSVCATLAVLPPRPVPLTTRPPAFSTPKAPAGAPAALWQREPPERRGIEAVIPVEGKESSGAFPAVAMAAGEPILGPQPWVTVLCKFADDPSELQPPAYFETMYDDLASYWAELSYDQMSLAGSTAVGWFTLPETQAYYILDGHISELRPDCLAEADPSVYYPDFYGVNMVYNGSLANTWAASGAPTPLTLDGVTRTWGTTFLPIWSWRDCVYEPAGCTTIKHEMGHAFGLPHSAGMYGQQYDSPWDIMSNSEHDQHTIAFHKDMLGWLPGDRKLVLLPGSVVTTTLERLALPTAEGYLVVQLPIPDGAEDGHFYTLEARRRVGRDQDLPGDAVIIHDVLPPFRPQPPPTLPAPPALVVDADDNFQLGDEGDMWTVGEVFVDATYAITVTVLSTTTTGYRIAIAYRPAESAVFLPLLSR